MSAKLNKIYTAPPTNKTINGKDFLLFDDVLIPGILNYDRGCRASIHGVCFDYDNKTLDQCMQLCEKDEDCGAGYFIDFKDKYTACVPLRTSVYPDANPAFGFFPSGSIEQEGKFDSKVFLKKGAFNYPAGNSACVYYQDIASLETLESKRSIETDGSEEQIRLGDFGQVHIRVFSPSTFFNTGLEVVVRFGDQLQLEEELANLLIKAMPDGKVVWGASSNAITNPGENIRILPVNSENKLGDKVVYRTPMRLQSDMGKYIGMNKTTRKLELVDMNSKDHETVFIFRSKNQFYECKNYQCVKYDKSDNPKLTINKDTLNFEDNGNIIFRNAYCSLSCDDTKPVRNYQLWTIFGVILFVSIIVFFLRKKILIYYK